jgi:hypothetical protein
MGQAARMKAENKETQKLTKEQRDGLEEHAINMALESTKSILGEQFVSPTFQDLQARIACAVGLAKMQFASSGMADIVALKEILKNEDEDEDEE